MAWAVWIWRRCLALDTFAFRGAGLTLVARCTITVYIKQLELYEGLVDKRVGDQELNVQSRTTLDMQP